MIFRYDSPVMQFMAKLFDMILLNLLFLVCCLPVVTVGASCTALHTVTLKYAAGDEVPVLSCFFSSFKKNFRQSTLMWLILFLAGGFLYVDSCMAAQLGTGGIAIKVVLAAASLVYSMVFLYLFPLQARYQNSIRASFRNAFLLAAAHFPKTLCMVCTVLLPLALLLYGTTEIFLLMVIFLLLVGCSVIAGIQARILYSIFCCHES